MKRVRQRTVGAGFNGIKVNVINETSRVNGSRFGGVQAYWLNEAGTFTGSRPKMRQFDLPLEKIIGLYYATDEILQDLVALESDVNDAFAAEIMFKCEDAIFNGAGAGLPQGVVGHAATVSVTAESGQSAATVLYKNLSKMYARLWAADRQGAAWFINQDVSPTLDDLFQAVGTAGIPPYFVTYSPDGIMKIKGLPVVTVEYAQTAGTVGDIILGNFDNYRWADKGGVKSDSSIHVAFTTAEQAFRWQYRANGKPFDIAPLTPKNGTNTLAHFVTLATRS
jgi:HK97 family phage major capsid protein